MIDAFLVEIIFKGYLNQEEKISWLKEGGNDKNRKTIKLK
ncbi:hypothetical protein BJ095_11921 [Ureibacillus chungkukjangi]|uniref:Uncharacterized protein n=1 Tax=Ureibacillus chungkukjangi TaxID=1202712 RepID=A0A318TMQ2_9BACL|nr:hypothetical protein BJ095_11921 [Ureibacillus chungkukjangi]